uniref:ribonuclease H n=1 Tax=Oncorhynchus tshawytscha TaxID=74940 RepID=A0AAZ3S090_ONCTS
MSVINCKAMIKPPMSNEIVKTIGASGLPLREQVTMPLPVSFCEEKCQHQFLYSDHCPVNLMGRDLLCKLGINITCGRTGLTVIHEEEEEEGEQLMLMSEGCDSYYAWDVDDEVPNIARVFSMAKTHWGHEGSFMSEAGLHCTSHFSPLTRDLHYEKQWLCDTLQNESVQCEGIYCSSDFCALGVNLTPAQKELYLFEDSTPHVSLAKSDRVEWVDTGIWMKCLVDATDWEMRPDGSTYSPSTLTSCYPLSWGTPTERGVHGVDQVSFSTNIMLLSEDSPLLRGVPECLWARDKYDFGRIKGAEPMVVTPKDTRRPSRAQYPLSKEAIAGITPVHASLLANGAVIPYPESPCNTPILPVRKPSGDWRFVQDLRPVNDAVFARAPVVPNVTTLLGAVPPTAEWFSVIDLTNAFFSIPVAPESQFWFAFTFLGKRFTWTVAPMGYVESAAISSAALAQNLEGFIPHEGSTLIQYVDDLLLCSSSVETCETDTRALLIFLAENGHKVSKKK